MENEPSAMKSATEAERAESATSGTTGEADSFRYSVVDDKLLPADSTRVLNLPKIPQACRKDRKFWLKVALVSAIVILLIFAIFKEELKGSLKNRKDPENPVALQSKWSQWSPWNTCSKSCGTGFQSRIRHCDQSGKESCNNGENSQDQKCNEQPCTVHGAWSNWSPWGSCSQECGSGTQNRTRLCDNPSPSADGRTCHGEDVQEHPCNTEDCPVHGGWSDWSCWNTCSQTCGSGVQERTRECNNPSPTRDGYFCVGEQSEKQACNRDICPDSPEIILTVGGYGKTRAQVYNSNYRRHEYQDIYKESNSSNLINPMSINNSLCPKPKDFTSKSFGVIGTFINGRAMVCNGAMCSEYNPKRHSWSLLGHSIRARDFAATAMLDEDKWWITGGEASPRTTEMYVTGKGFMSYHTLPDDRIKHCLVKVNATHFFLVGGSINATYMFNLTEGAWERQKDIPLASKGAACGLVTMNDGSQEIVVTGGYNSTYLNTTHIFSLTSQTWRKGVDLPEAMDGMGSVPWGKSMLVLGGRAGEKEFHDTIYQYDLEKGFWWKLLPKTNKKSAYFASILVPKESFECAHE